VTPGDKKLAQKRRADGAGAHSANGSMARSNRGCLDWLEVVIAAGGDRRAFSGVVNLPCSSEDVVDRSPPSPAATTLPPQEMPPPPS
jgi:hypothetical protein